MEQQTQPLARGGLLLNAVVSTFCGLLLALAPSTVGAWLGVDIDVWLRLLGFGLLGHAAILAWVIRQAAIAKWTKLNLFVIAPYPLIMVGIVVAGLVDKGQALLLIDGAIVGLAALMQWLGLRN